jgi:hypothetical protein
MNLPKREKKQRSKPKRRRRKMLSSLTLSRVRVTTVNFTPSLRNLAPSQIWQTV